MSLNRAPTSEERRTLISDALIANSLNLNQPTQSSTPETKLHVENSVNKNPKPDEVKTRDETSSENDPLLDPAEVVAVDNLTGVVQLKSKKTGRYYLGKFIAGAFAIGCGFTTVAALASTMALIAPVFLASPWFYPVAIGLFFSTSFANYRMTRMDLPQILMEGIKGLFNNKITLPDGTEVYEPISTKRKALLITGIVLGTTLGIAIGALTIFSVASLPTTFAFLAVAGAAFWPLGAFLGVVTAICLTAIMIKAFSKLVKAQNLKQTFKDILSNLFLPHPIKDKGKSTARFLCERIPVWIALVAIAAGSLGLAFWGETYTLKTCAMGLADITAKLFHGTSTAVNVLNIIITRGLALAAQVPFTIMTTLNPILQLFYRRTPKTVVNDTEFKDKNAIVAKPTTFWEKAEPILGAIASFFNAFGNGLVALSGKALDTVSWIGTTGATVNSFFSTFGNTIPTTVPTPPSPVSSRRSSTADLLADPFSRGSGIDRGTFNDDSSNDGSGGDHCGNEEKHNSNITRRRFDSVDPDIIRDLVDPGFETSDQSSAIPPTTFTK